MLGMPGASRLAMQNPNNIVAGGNTSVETNIGEIKIYTAAQDAKGIADDMSTAMDSLFSSQANYGLR